MQIFIKYDKTFAYDVEPDWTISKVKHAIKDKLGWPVKMQRLMYAGKMLEDQKTLEDYDITSMATVQLSARMEGGQRMRIYVSCKS